MRRVISTCLNSVSMLSFSLVDVGILRHALCDSGDAHEDRRLIDVWFECVWNHKDGMLIGKRKWSISACWMLA